MGMVPRLQMSLPVDDTVELAAKRSSQRAELLAAIFGLRALGSLKDAGELHPADWAKRRNADKPSNWIAATDSKYVVDGMTNWLPTKWKVRMQSYYVGPILKHQYMRSFFLVEWNAHERRAHPRQPTPLPEAR